MWAKRKQGDSEMRSPRILAKNRIALKLVNDVMQKCLRTCDLCTIVLDNNNTASKGNEKENSSLISTNEEDVNSRFSIIKDIKNK